MQARLSLERVAVTGATGFIGQHLVRALVAGGSRPVLLARREPAFGEPLPWEPFELQDGESVRAAVRAARPSVLIHLAGTRARERAGRGALAAAQLNVAATVRLLVEALDAGVGRIVLLGSAEEYGDQSGPLHEELPLQARSAYGVSKAAVTGFARALHASDGLPVVIVRPFSVYGPGQPRDMFVSGAVAAAVAGEPFEMTAGLQQRDLVYVEDVVDGIVRAAAQPGIEGETLNLGTGQPHALRDVAAAIWRLSASAAPLRIGARPAPEHELYHTWADPRRARERLGWSAATVLETGLRATIAWQRQRRAE